MSSTRAVTDGGSDADTVALLGSAAALRWSRPDLTGAVADHVAETDADDQTWLRASGWAVYARSATGDGRETASAVLERIAGRGLHLLDDPAAHRLRVELAVLAAGAGRVAAARTLLTPVIVAGTAPELRADALGALARCAVEDRPGTVTDLLRRVEAAWTEVGGYRGDVGAAAAALVAVMAERRRGQLAECAERAAAGLARLDRARASRVRSPSRHVAAALAGEWIAALVDAGRSDDAREGCGPFEPRLRDTARPSRQVALLRLTVARTLAGAGVETVAETLEQAARDAAASDAPDLEAVCWSTLGALHEKADRLDDALESIRLGVAAQRRDQRRAARFQVALAAVVPVGDLGDLPGRLAAGGSVNGMAGGPAGLAGASGALAPARNGAAPAGNHGRRPMIETGVIETGPIETAHSRTAEPRTGRHKSAPDAQWTDWSAVARDRTTSAGGAVVGSGEVPRSAGGGRRQSSGVPEGPPDEPPRSGGIDTTGAHSINRLWRPVRPEVIAARQPASRQGNGDGSAIGAPTVNTPAAAGGSVLPKRLDESSTGDVLASSPLGEASGTPISAWADPWVRVVPSASERDCSAEDLGAPPVSAPAEPRAGEVSSPAEWQGGRNSAEALSVPAQAEVQAPDVASETASPWATGHWSTPRPPTSGWTPSYGSAPAVFRATSVWLEPGDGVGSPRPGGRRRRIDAEDASTGGRSGAAVAGGSPTPGMSTKAVRSAVAPVRAPSPPTPAADGCVIVIDLAREGRRFAGPRAGAVVRAVADRLTDRLPIDARLRHDDPDALSVTLPGWSRSPATEWMHRTLPDLLAGFVAAEDLPGMHLRAAVHDVDGPVGAQLLQRLDILPLSDIRPAWSALPAGTRAGSDGPRVAGPPSAAERANRSEVRRAADPGSGTGGGQSPPRTDHGAAPRRHRHRREPAALPLLVTGEADPAATDGMGLADLLAGALAEYRGI